MVFDIFIIFFIKGTSLDEISRVVLNFMAYRHTSATMLLNQT